MHAFPPKQEQCMRKTKHLVFCSSPSTRHEGGTSRAASTVAVHHVSLSTGKQEEGSGTGTGSKANFMICKVRGGAGTKGK